MTLREVQVLLLLYRACGDQAARRRAVQLLPDLADLVLEIAEVGDDSARRYLIQLQVAGRSIGQRAVTCRPSDVGAVAATYRDSADPAAVAVWAEVGP